MPSPAKVMSAAPIPARTGVGLKPEHASQIIATWPDIGWFEIHAENYMEAGGRPHHDLSRIRERYPLSVHGVGMSIGGMAPLDTEHLARLRAVCKHYRPALVSEHLAWSTHDGIFYNDLLPLPYTSETLRRVCEHIGTVQEALGRAILLENPSTYLQFVAGDWPETAFLAEIARRTGCGLLLDVNNVAVCATNHGFDAREYLADFPLEYVGEIHLAGNAVDCDDAGAPLLIDAHDTPVTSEVWELFSEVVARLGAIPTLIEWDNDVPAWDRLLAEAHDAEAVLTTNGGRHVGHAA